MTDGLERLAVAFGHGPAVMPYVMAGLPDPATSLAVGQACVDAGADLIELGMPCSDQLSGYDPGAAAALTTGVTSSEVLDIAAELATTVPVVLMSYANIMFTHGVDVFVKRLERARVSGIIVPDLPLEEADPVRTALDAAGIALIAISTPTTPRDRLIRLGATARGFLYATAVRQMTGDRTEFAADLPQIVATAAAHTTVPIMVGFGITTPAKAVAVANAGADGLVIGGPALRAALDADNPAQETRQVVRGFVTALRAPAT